MTLDTALKLAPLVGAALVALLRQVPPSFWAQNPRLGELFRMLRAAAPDLIKVGRAALAVVRPPPPDNVIPMPPRHPRTGEPQ